MRYLAVSRYFKHDTFSRSAPAEAMDGSLLYRQGRVASLWPEVQVCCTLAASSFADYGDTLSEGCLRLQRVHTRCRVSGIDQPTTFRAVSRCPHLKRQRWSCGTSSQHQRRNCANKRRRLNAKSAALDSQTVIEVRRQSTTQRRTT